jgi:D-alanyl-D-alanine dipeptidase
LQVINILEEFVRVYVWLGEYIKAVYRFGVSIASILGVIMIIVEGVRIVISAGGEEKVAGYKHIGRICAGLCLAWFSYVILYNINSDLVSFQALKIKSAESSDNYAYDDNSELENKELSKAGEIIKKSKPQLVIDAAEYRECTNNDWEGGKGSNTPCLGSKDGAYDPAKVKACGVMPKKYMVETNCNGKLKNLDGRTASAYVIDGMDVSLCKAVDIAIREGYELRFSSAWRDFDTQARGWCRQAAESGGKHSGSRAAPGYSNHGTGQAIDIFLYKDGKSLTLSNFSSQCSIAPDAIEKIAKIFYEADGANFNRLRKEIWHFEYKGLVDAAHGKFIGYPVECSGKNHS